MNKTDKKTLEEIIRVDHAGERGAIKIYEGQLLALKTFKQDEELKKKIEDMREHEKEHYEFFDKEIQKRNIKPTRLLPCLLYTSPSPRDSLSSRMPSSA